jgi:hypothetical protein
MLSSQKHGLLGRILLCTTIASFLLLPVLINTPLAACGGLTTTVSEGSSTDTSSAEIYGEVYLPDGRYRATSAKIYGRPVDSEASTCREIGSIDNSGTYALNLPPGAYLFAILFQHQKFLVTATVTASGGREDLQLREMDSASSSDPCPTLN